MLDIHIAADARHRETVFLREMNYSFGGLLGTVVIHAADVECTDFTRLARCGGSLLGRTGR